MSFDERNQQPNEKLDTFLDDLEELRIRATPEEPLKTQNLEIMRKFMTGLLDHELHQSLLTSYTGEYYAANPPTVEEILSKCHDYLTLRKINGGYRAAQKIASVTNENMQQTPTTWVTPNTSSSNQNRAVTSMQQNVSAAQSQGQSKSSDAQQLQGKAPIDRSNWRCYSCGALGHIARECGGYRKSLCKMGYGPPPGLTDPDELDKHYTMAVKLAPIHCFHCMELGHMKPACPLLNLENSGKLGVQCRGHNRETTGPSNVLSSAPTELDH